MLNPSSAPDVRFTIRRTRRNGIDRLSLVGALDRDSVLVLEGELNAVARAGGALILDLRELTSIDRWGLHTIERVARRLDPCTSRIYIVNGDGPVSEALETAGMGDLLTGSDLSELLDAGDGTWSSTSLPPFPAQRVNTQLQVAEERP